jgi:hypothetical protein
MVADILQQGRCAWLVGNSQLVGETRQLGQGRDRFIGHSLWTNCCLINELSMALLCGLMKFPHISISQVLKPICPLIRCSKCLLPTNCEHFAGLAASVAHCHTCSSRHFSLYSLLRKREIPSISLFCAIGFPPLNSCLSASCTDMSCCR